MEKGYGLVSLFMSLPSLQQEGVVHGFFTAQASVRQDRPDMIRKADLLCSEALGLSSERFVRLRQVHSVRVFTLTSLPSSRPEADAMVTKEPGLGLVIRTADCVPLLFLDPIARVVGAAHVGWRGAFAGITSLTVEAMEALGARAEQMVAGIGPCIHQPSYEVDAEFHTTFLAQDRDNSVFFKSAPSSSSQKRFLFDFPGYVAKGLKHIGIPVVETLPYDTFQEESLFHSYRRYRSKGRKGAYEHQLSLIALTA